MKGIYGDVSHTQVIDKIQRGKRDALSYICNSPTPATALYDYWLMVLDGAGQLPSTPIGTCGMPFGHKNNWGIGVICHDSNDHPILSYGPLYWNKVGEGLTINSGGEFRLGNLHGWKQRDSIARSSFLCWSNLNREYLWFVDPARTAGEYDRKCSDWQAPIHYVGESVMSCRWNRRSRTGGTPWLRLQKNGDEWQIRFSREADGPVNRNQVKVTQEDFDHHDKLRARRYRLLEKEWAIRNGLLDVYERPVLTDEEREEREKRQIDAIVAHLDVTMPARSTPLRKKPKEEPLWELPGCP